MYVCIYVSMYTKTYVCMYTYTHLLLGAENAASIEHDTLGVALSVTL